MVEMNDGNLPSKGSSGSAERKAAPNSEISQSTKVGLGEFFRPKLDHAQRELQDRLNKKLEQAKPSGMKQLLAALNGSSKRDDEAIARLTTEAKRYEEMQGIINEGDTEKVRQAVAPELLGELVKLASQHASYELAIRDPKTKIPPTELAVSTKTKLDTVSALLEGVGAKPTDDVLKKLVDAHNEAGSKPDFPWWEIAINAGH